MLNVGYMKVFVKGGEDEPLHDLDGGAEQWNRAVWCQILSRLACLQQGNYQRRFPYWWKLAVFQRKVEYICKKSQGHWSSVFQVEGGYSSGPNALDALAFLIAVSVSSEVKTWGFVILFFLSWRLTTLDSLELLCSTTEEYCLLKLVGYLHWIGNILSLELDALVCACFGISI